MTEVHFLANLWSFATAFGTISMAMATVVITEARIHGTESSFLAPIRKCIEKGVPLEKFGYKGHARPAGLQVAERHRRRQMLPQGEAQKANAPGLASQTRQDIQNPFFSLVRVHHRRRLVKVGAGVIHHARIWCVHVASAFPLGRYCSILFS